MRRAEAGGCRKFGGECDGIRRGKSLESSNEQRSQEIHPATLENTLKGATRRTNKTTSAACQDNPTPEERTTKVGLQLLQLAWALWC